MKFSIITVSLNDATGLERTYRSVIAQSCEDYEWLVLDGGSCDSTKDWLSGLNMARLRWWSQPDKGHFDAMNRGIERARGDYMVFLNAGDELACDSVLESVRNAGSGPPVADLVFGDALDVAPDGSVLYRKARSHTSLWWTMFTCHQAMFFRRERVGETRYRLRYKHAADFAFVAEYLRDDHPAGRPVVGRLDEALCRFWLGGHSWQHRTATIGEDFHIRAHHLGVPMPVNVALFLAHQVHTWLKRKTPGLARRMRY